MSNEIRIGVVSMIPPSNNPDSSFKIIKESIVQYSFVDLLCFGELFLFNNPLLLESIKYSKKIFMITSEIKEFSRKYEVAVSYGYIVKEHAKYYICQRITFPDGTEYTYRKVHLGKNEAKVFHPGDKIDVFNYKGYTFGVQICVDTHIMEMSILQKKLGGTNNNSSI